MRPTWTHPLCDMCGYVMPNEKWAWLTIKRKFTDDALTFCHECTRKLLQLIEKADKKHQVALEGK